jgi:hypothetical protein
MYSSQYNKPQKSQFKPKTVTKASLDVQELIVNTQKKQLELVDEIEKKQSTDRVYILLMSHINNLLCDERYSEKHRVNSIFHLLKDSLPLIRKNEKDIYLKEHPKITEFNSTINLSADHGEIGFPVPT